MRFAPLSSRSPRRGRAGSAAAPTHRGNAAAGKPGGGGGPGGSYSGGSYGPGYAAADDGYNGGMGGFGNQTPGPQPGRFNHSLSHSQEI